MNTVAWRRSLIVLVAVAVVATAVAVVRIWMRPTGGSSPAPAQTSEPVPRASASVQGAPLAPPLPAFPDQDGFTDVSREHDVSNLYPLATFTSPAGLQCAMWSNRGSTAASCFGKIPGLDHPASHAYAGDYGAYFDQNSSPATEKLNGKPLASGEKIILGAGGSLMGGNQITCGVEGDVVACMLIRNFHENHGDETAQRHGFVVGPDKSWTF